ncbi:hypothetical protein PS15p_201344 [Mucor circinelloides]
MLKTILSLRSDFAAVGSIIKLYGLQVYHNEIYVYNMHCPINNMYMFQEDKSIKIPHFPCFPGYADKAIYG